MTDLHPPARGDLPAALLPHARRIHREDPELATMRRYEPLRGPLHWATGPWWPDHLRKMAQRWRKAAGSAELIADWWEGLDDL